MQDRKRARNIVIYDGACGVCQVFREHTERYDRRRELEFIPYQTPDLERFAPGLSSEAAREALYFLRWDGKRFRGARAVFEVMKCWPGVWGRLGRVLAFPPLSWGAEPFYRLLARHRARVSRWLRLERCAFWSEDG